MGVSGLFQSPFLPAVVLGLMRHLHELNAVISHNTISTLKEHEAELYIQSLRLQVLTNERLKCNAQLFNTKVKCQ
jgi:hypothetical protein